VGCKHYQSEWEKAEAYNNGLRGQRVKDFLKAQEIHEPRDFGDAMRAYLEMPVNEALKSADPLVKAFALVDRRVGKRTVEKIEISDSEHTLVRAFYELRFSAMHT
jgi:hypothetical protein